MYSNNNIESALPIYAQHLSEATGVKVVINGDGAFTDGKTVNVPFVKDGDASLAFGFMAHECSHVRNTDMMIFREASSIPMRKNLLNILEDIRIERMSMDQYPGTEPDIRYLNRKVLLEPFKPEHVAQANPLAIIHNAILFGAYWTLQEPQLEVPAKAYLAALVSQVGQKLADEILSVACQTLSCNSTHEVLGLVDRIIAMLPTDKPDDQNQSKEESKDEGDDQSQESESAPDGSGDEEENGNQGDSTGDSGDESEGNSTGDSGDESEGDSTGDSGDESEGDSTGDSGDESEGDSTGASEGSGGQGLDLKAMLENATSADLKGLISDLGDAAQQLLDEEAKRKGVVEAFSVLGRPKAAFLNEAAKAKQLGEASSAGLRQVLSGLIQGKTSNRVRLKRQGRRIDTGRIAMLKGGETRIFRSKATSQGETAAIQFLVDRSGSMRPYMIEVEAALYSVLKALDPIKEVTTGALGFPEITQNHFGPNEVGTSLIKAHGERLSQAYSNKGFGAIAVGSTPLSEALWSAVAELCRANAKKADKRILFVLTDGVPDDFASAKRMVADIEKAGIKVIGLGFGAIDHEVVTRIFSNYRAVGQVGNLRTALFELVRELAF